MLSPSYPARSADPAVAVVEQLLDEEVAATSIHRATALLGISRDTVRRILRRRPVHPGTLALVKERLAAAGRGLFDDCHANGRST